jgi:hypothetical protein
LRLGAAASKGASARGNGPPEHLPAADEDDGQYHGGTVPSRALTGGFGDANSPGSDVSLECRVLCVQPSGQASRRDQRPPAAGPAVRPPRPLDGDAKEKEVGVDACLGTRAEAASQWRQHERGHAPGMADVAGAGSGAKGGAYEAPSCGNGEVGISDCAKRRRVTEAPGDGADRRHARGLDRPSVRDPSCRNSRASSSTVGWRSGGSGDVVHAVEGDSLGPPARRRIRGKTSCSRSYGEMNTLKSTLAAAGHGADAGAAAGGGNSSATSRPMS